MSQTTKIEIDNEKYSVCRVFSKDWRGKLVLSCLLLSRTDPVSARMISWSFDGFSETHIVTFPVNDEKVDAKTEILYFIQDGKIIFEKSYKELGIDVSRITTGRNDGLLTYLRPILEKLIREHVQPQDTETEEQEK